MPEVTATVDVCVVCSGAPKRGMGWYHCKQLFDNRVKGARLTDVVEPWFLGKGKGSSADFEEWQKKSQGIAFHEKIGDVPVPAGAPKLAIICCRTMDAPRIFREAIDHGFTHVYLEKPGAPTVADLEEMTKYAKDKGVPVFMGFNRNFSKYVRLAQDFYTTAPASASLTIGRNDMFNSPEAMDECFERNAEGMMKNMMIHELVVLISYFGLTVDAIDAVVQDKASCIILMKDRGCPGRCSGVRLGLLGCPALVRLRAGCLELILETLGKSSPEVAVNELQEGGWLLVKLGRNCRRSNNGPRRNVELRTG
ncbi:unnamed protein product [Prorocentrum cordatum]|uniref:Gfo/Idh/MocA-like oxidoreductase N-terminal domain-containing protein n=1 Tax=Prorocentrum cordatum TaxID=2364126 RepID=A0ABN9VMN2_9DINO|nr:unnamed protein product [Polarella glacialis]